MSDFQIRKQELHRAIIQALVDMRVAGNLTLARFTDKLQNGSIVRTFRTAETCDIAIQGRNHDGKGPYVRAEFPLDEVVGNAAGDAWCIMGECIIRIVDDPENGPEPLEILAGTLVDRFSIGSDIGGTNNFITPLQPGVRGNTDRYRLSVHTQPEIGHVYEDGHGKLNAMVMFKYHGSAIG